MKKVVISGLMVLMFCISYGFYLYADALKQLPKPTLKLWNYYSLGFIIFGTWLIEKSSVDSFLQESILNGGKLLVFLCFLNIIFTQHLIITDPYTNLRIFLGGSSFALSALLYEILNRYINKWAIVITVLFGTFLFLLLAAAVCLI